MRLKSILASLIPGPWKNKEVAGERAPEQQPVSPYAKYLEERGAIVEDPHTDTPTRDIFLLGEIAQKPPGTVGLFYPGQGTFQIRDPYRGETGRILRKKVNPSWVPLFGDWTGCGSETIGFYDDHSGYFSLWNSNEHKQADMRFFYGLPGRGWIPIVGDWNSDGKDGIGLYDPALGIFFLRNELAEGLPEAYFPMDACEPGCIPVAGDWDGDGADGVGLYQPGDGIFWLRNRLSRGKPEIRIAVGKRNPDCVPVVGDWNGDGSDKVGLYDPKDSTFSLWTNGGESETTFHFSSRGGQARPFAVRWTL
jgi:hypothetical protein